MQIVFRDFKYLFRFIFSNSYLLFLHKILEKHLWNSFLLYLLVEIWNKLLYKRGFLKNYSKFSDKHKEHSSGGVQSKDVLKNSVKFTEKYLCRILLFNKVAGWKPETDRSSRWRFFLKQVVFKNFVNFTGKNICWSLIVSF